MLQLSDLLNVQMKWSSIVWYELVILLVGALLLQTLLNVYTEKKLNYFLPRHTNIISYILTVIFFTGGYIFVGGITINLVIVLIAIAILSSTSLIDVHYQELPNEYNIALTVLSLTYLGFNHTEYENILMGGIIAFLLFFIILVVSGSVGGGDVKMSFAIGAFIGAQSLLVWVMLTFFSGAIVAIILMLTKKMGRKEFFAFGPFMAFSSIYLMLFFM